MRSAAVPFAFAIILLFAGGYAYLSAPESANAATALIFPGACAVIMIILGLALVVAIPGRMGLARVVHLVGVVLSLLFMVAFVMRAIPTVKQSNAYRIAAQEHQQRIEDGQLEDTPADRAAHFEQYDQAHPSVDVPDHDKQYLAFTLFTLSAVSALAFVGMLATPPRGQKQLAASDVRTPAPEAPDEARD